MKRSRLFVSTTALLLLIVGSGLASAGDIYVNGVRADSLRDVEMTDVDVRFDATGNLWIDASSYVVEVDDGQTAPPAAVPLARYWLVTDDQGSVGQVVDVVINGTLVRKIRSGEKQLILDLQPFLRGGPNVVLLNGIPTRKGGGGPLRVFVGSGNNEGGTVHLDPTEISLRRDATDAPQAESKSFTLDAR